MILPNKQPLVTVFTCVYNGSKTIHRVFNSMLGQTYKNIEHIIVDDGSTDFDCVQPLLDEYIASAPFDVRVFHKGNGGKHTATNLAWDKATGDFVIKLDADDELLPDCIEFLVQKWFEIPIEIRNEYWCVHGRCMDQNKHEFIGDMYPDNINELSISGQDRAVRHTKGEKTGLMLKSVLDMYRYPEPGGVNFVTEEIVWIQIRQKWKIWCTNKIVRVYYINEGPSLAHPIRSRQTFANNAYNKSWFLGHRNIFRLSKKQTVMYVLKYAISYVCATKDYRGVNKYFFSDNDRLLTALLLAAYFPALLLKPFLNRRYKL